jgi:hypothetical protein
MKLLFLPKLYSFEMETMIILTMLAAVQYNLCAEGSNLLNIYVLSCQSILWSKKRLCAELKNRNIRVNHAIKKSILLDIEENIKKGTHIPYNLSGES